MEEIKTTCTSLSALLHTIKKKKDSEGVEIDETLIADAMSLFAQLSGQHHTILQQQDTEDDKCNQMKEKCEENQHVLEEQLAYVNYMDKEYDTSPWKPDDGIISVNSSDDHPIVKSKLDSELEGRRKMCEYGNTLEDEVVKLRKSEQETRVELERVRKVMCSVSTPSFLDGISAGPYLQTTTALPAPLFTFHQLVSSALREPKYNNIKISVETDDPLQSISSFYTNKHDLSVRDAALIAHVPYLVVLCMGETRVVIRYHDQIGVVSCDNSLSADYDVLAGLSSGDDGTVAPHTSLNFTFQDPTISEIVEENYLGKLYCWLHELCGLDVVPEIQRKSPSNITPVKLLNFLVDHYSC